MSETNDEVVPQPVWRKKFSAGIVQFLPAPPGGTADTALMEAVNPTAQKRLTKCEAAIREAPRDNAALLVDYVRGLQASEEARWAAITARAQNLFFIAALLTAGLAAAAVGIAVAHAMPAAERWLIGVGLALLLAQIVLLTLSAVAAVRDAEPPRPITAMAHRWARMAKAEEIPRDDAILTLKSYRELAYRNSWRFSCLARAGMAFRNAVLLAGLLVLALLVFSLAIG